VNRRILIAVTTLITIGFVIGTSGDAPSRAADVDGKASDPDSGKAPKCELNITLPKHIHRKGKNRIVIQISNVGEAPATFVMPGDGSSRHWRTPIVGWSCLPVESDKVHPKKPPLHTGGRCGNINRLRASEVFDVQPGAAVKLNEWAYFPLNLAVGKYRVVFYYTNKPDTKWKGLQLGKHDEKAMQRLKNSTPISLISNEVEVEIIQ
jgi:hypothetical protein